MKSAVLRIGSVVAVLLLCLGLFFALRAPQGYAALRERRGQVHDLEKQNGDLAKENLLKRERIQRLMHDRNEIDKEIRARMKKLKPGETQFIIQDGK